MSDPQKQDDDSVVDLEVMKLGLGCAYGAAEVVHHENPDFEIRVFRTSIHEHVDFDAPAPRQVGFYLTSPQGESSLLQCGWDRTRQDMEQMLRALVQMLREDSYGIEEAG